MTDEEMVEFLMAETPEERYQRELMAEIQRWLDKARADERVPEDRDWTTWTWTTDNTAGW